MHLYQASYSIPAVWLADARKYVSAIDLSSVCGKGAGTNGRFRPCGHQLHAWRRLDAGTVRVGLEGMGTMRRILLGTSALFAMGVGGGAAGADPIVKPGGGLDIRLSGFARFLAVQGDVDNLRLDDDRSRGLDFFNDTEVHVIVEGKDDATGLGYGGRIELEGDTNATNNSDETWVFVRGGFGEVRFGDEDGIADMDGLAVSADTISLGVGTDGLDSDQLEVLAGGVRVFEPLGTSDATKIRYVSPTFGGLKLGASYTPNLSSINSGSDNGDSLALEDVEAGDVFEGGLQYTREWGGLELTAGLTGLLGDIKDEGEAGGDDYWAWQAGLVIEFEGFKVGGGYLDEEAGGIEARSVTVGVGAEFGPVELALTYGRFLDTSNITVDPDEDDDVPGNTLGDHPQILILSGTIGLLPGLTLGGDLAYFDNDVEEGPKSGSDDGYQALGRLALAF